MAKRQREPIRVEAYVTVGGVERNVDTLTEEQRRYLGTCLKTRYLNNLFAGRAVFSPREELPPVGEVFPGEKDKDEGPAAWDG